MEALKRLNENQLINRQARLAATLNTMYGDQLYQMLLSMGVIARMVQAGCITTVSEGDVSAMEALAERDPAEAAKEAMLRGLERGDAQVLRIYQESLAAEKAKQDFQVNVKFTSYRVADASLPTIIMEADENIVMQLIDSLVQRSEMDECPKQVIDSLTAAAELWNKWAKVGLKPRLKSEDMEEDDDLKEEEQVEGTPVAGLNVPA